MVVSTIVNCCQVGTETKKWSFHAAAVPSNNATAT